MDRGLRRLAYFRVLARELHFTRAAEKLMLTQSALTRAIILLEEEIGTPLFERSKRHVRLTPAGEMFLKGCDRVVDTIEGAIDQARKAADGRLGRLSIGYTDTAISGRLPDIVNIFRRTYPDVEIKFFGAYTKQLLEMLSTGQLDVGFMTGPVTHPDVAAIDVQVDRLVAIVPKSHELAGRRAIRLAELADSDFILGDLAHWTVYHEMLFRACKKAGFEPRIVQTAPDLRGIVGLVSCGMGVSVQTECLTLVGDNRVSFKSFEDCEEKLLTQAAWNRRFSNPCKEKFIEMVPRALGMADC